MSSSPSDRPTSQGSTRPTTSRVSITNGLQNGTYNATRMKPAVPLSNDSRLMKNPVIPSRDNGNAMIWRSSGLDSSEPAAA